MMIETTGYDMNPFFLAKDKILGMSQHGENTQQTRVFMLGEDDYWIMNESVLTLRVKYDNA